MAINSFSEFEYASGFGEIGEQDDSNAPGKDRGSVTAPGNRNADIPTRVEQSESLDETLLLLNRVVHAAVTSIVVTDPHLPDNPIVYHNPAFEVMSGYSASEIDGYNCRFLQGKESDPATVAEIRRAIVERQPCHVLIQNYRKDGTPFWNDLAISPVHDDAGRLTHFVGVQTDVTRRAEAERERDVLLAQQQRIADTLQRALLLTPLVTKLNDLEVSTQYEAAFDEAQFGGDFFDTVTLTGDKVALVVGDCTGKGLKAAQYTAEVKYALRVLLREYGHPTPALHRLNAFLIDSQRLDARDLEALVCVSVAVINTTTGETQVAAAGMEPALIVRQDGTAEPVVAEGLILGIDPGAEYTAVTATLGVGDTIVLVTDGITEARGPLPKRDLFGYESLVSVARKAVADSQTVEAMGERIVQAAKSFAAGKLQDDICVLLAHRNEPSDVEAPQPHPAESEGLTVLENGAANIAEQADRDLAHFAMEVTGLGYWELNTATGILRHSARHDEILGYDETESSLQWDYTRFLSHVHPDDHARVDALYGRALATGTDWQFECRILRAGDGAVRWIEAKGRHFRDNGVGGTSPRIIGTIRDITDIKEAEQTVQNEVRLRQEAYEFAQRVERDAADQLRLVTDAAPLLISYVDRDLRYRLVNQGYADWFGVPKEQIVGRTVAEVIGQAAFQASLQRIEKVLSGERLSYEATLPYDEGRTPRYVHADMVPDVTEDGTVRGYVAVVIDETMRKRAEDDAQKQRDEISTVFERITDAVVAFDHEWRFTFANRAAERLTGRTASDLLGKSHWDEFSATQGTIIETEYRRAVREQVPVQFDQFYPPLNTWFEVHAYPSPSGLSVYFRDVTEEKWAERRERLLSELSERVRFLPDPDVILYESARTVGEFTGASRATFGEIEAGDSDDATISVYRDYVREGVPSIAGLTRPLLSFGRKVIESLRSGRVTASEDILADERVLPEHRAAFAELGIRAFVGAPIHREGRWVSLLVLHHAEPRLWSAEECDLLADIAESTRLAVDNARFQREEKRGAERLRLAAGIAGLGAWEIDLTMNPAVNTLDARAAEMFGKGTSGDRPLVVRGGDWAEWIHPDDRDRIVAEFTDAVNDSTVREYRMEYRVYGPDAGSVRWILSLANMVRDGATGKTLRILGVCRDITDEKEAVGRQRTFLKEMLFGLTEGRLKLCDSPDELPAPLSPAHAPIDLAPLSIRQLRKQVGAVGEKIGFDEERVQGLETAVGEAGMNAVRHAGGGEGRVHADSESGVIQVWIRDTGSGIDENLIHRAIERGWTTGGFGQGMFLMHRSVDRMFLLTGSEGTTVVLEQDRTAPIPVWMQNASI
ncbi:MAG: PAS domain S-box protein [Fibrella sp.]|nr:PAS domain S-box protein [Armatimonadota bacterium]